MVQMDLPEHLTKNSRGGRGQILQTTTLRWWRNLISAYLQVLKNSVQQTNGGQDAKTNVADPFFKVYQGAWVTAGMGGGGLGENYYISYFGRVSFQL